MHIFHNKQIISGTVVYTHPPSPPPSQPPPSHPHHHPTLHTPPEPLAASSPTHARITCKTKQFIQGIGGYKCRFTLLFTYGAKRSRGVYVQKYVSPQPPPPTHHPPPPTPQSPPPPTHTLPLPNNFPPHFTPPTPLPNPRLHKMYNNVPRGRGGGGWVAINVDQHCCLRMVQRDPCPPPPPLEEYICKKWSPPP